MCKVYIVYCGTSEIEHGLCACTVDNLLVKARGVSLCTGTQTMLYLSHVNETYYELKSKRCTQYTSKEVKLQEKPLY